MFISSDTELSIDSTSAVALVPPDKGRHTRAQRTVSSHQAANESQLSKANAKRPDAAQIKPAAGWPCN